MLYGEACNRSIRNTVVHREIDKKEGRGGNIYMCVMNDHTNYDNKMINLICSTYCYFNYKHYHKHKKLNYTKVNMIVLITSIINANININIHSNVHIS